MMGVMVAVAAGLLGALAGWFVGRMGLSRRVVESARATSDLSAQLDAERSRVAELEDELRAEQLLLDEVAARNRMTPRAFRETVALDYLHPADPQRQRHLSEDVIDLTEPHDRGAESASVLAGQERDFDAIETALRRIRLDLEAVIESGADVRPCPLAAETLRARNDVVELRDEVAELRRRLADRQVDADRLSHQLASTEPDADLRRISAELADLRARVVDLQS